jgi:hypothetical protein
MHKRFCLLVLGTIVSVLAARVALAQSILNVGPNAAYHTISAAVAVADADTNLADYYVVEIAPGTYTNDFPVVTRPMTIEVDPARAGQAVILNAAAPPPNEKGIILNTANLTVDGLTFQGAQIANGLGGNAAGIRDQNLGSPAILIVENSSFISNQDGILAGDNASQSIYIINTNFINNGNTNVNYFTNALYVNYIGSLSVSSSRFCGQLWGQDIKSRAMVTNVSDNQLYDGQADAALGCPAGSSSLAIDVSNGGIATITGNAIIQGPASPNYKMVEYGEEGMLYASNDLWISDNTFSNTGSSTAIGIYDPNCTPVQLSGDSFTGIATPVSPSSCVAGSQ